jgi:hypothetical protein
VIVLRRLGRVGTNDKSRMWGPFHRDRITNVERTQIEPAGVFASRRSSIGIVFHAALCDAIAYRLRHCRALVCGIMAGQFRGTAG